MASIYQHNSTKQYILSWLECGKKKYLNLYKEYGCTSEKEALEIKKAKETELKFGKTVLVSTTPTLYTFIPKFKQWKDFDFPNSSERRNQIIDQYILPKLGHLKLDQITKMDVKEFEIERSKTGVAKETIIKEVRVLMSILNFAVDHEFIEKHKIKGYKVVSGCDSAPPRFFTIEELDIIYGFSKTHYVWKFLANTGLRRSEFLTLKKQWIGNDEFKVVSTEENRTKSKKFRTIPLFDGAKESLDYFKFDDIFLAERKTKNAFSNQAAREITRCGLSGSVHTYRHTFCSHLVMNRVPLKVVQELAGHSSITVTEKYAHLDPDKTINKVQLCL